MNDYLVINENSGSSEPGDIMIFRSPSSAADYLEPIDVQNNAYVGVFGDGTVAGISTTGATISIKRDDGPLRGDLLERYLRHAWINHRSLGTEAFPDDLAEALRRIGFDS